MRTLCWILSCLLVVYIVNGQDNSSHYIDSLMDHAWDISLKNPVLSIQITKNANEIATKEHDEIRIGQTLNYLGIYYSDIGLFEDAERHFLDAIIIKKKLKDIKGVVSVYNNLSHLKEQQGELQKAIEYGYAAKTVLDNFPNKKVSRLAVLVNLGKVHRVNQDTSLALNFFKAGLKEARVIKDSVSIGSIQYNLGQYFEELEELDKAYNAYSEALQLFDSLKLEMYFAKTQNALGTISLKKKQLEEAKDWFKKSMKINFREKDSLTLFYNFYGLSQLHLEEQNVDSALIYCKKAEALLFMFGGLKEREQIFSQYVQIYEKIEDFEKAYQYDKKVEVLRDSLYNIEKSKEIIKIQTLYETQKLQSEKFEAQAQKNIAVGGIAVLATLLLGGYFYYRNRQKVLKTINQQQAKLHENEVEDLLKKQEIKFIGARLEGREIEREAFYEELHHNIGNQLLTAKWKFDNILSEYENKNIDTDHLQKATELLGNVYQEVRKVHDKVGSGNVKKLGIKAAITDLAQSVTEDGNLHIQFLPYGDFSHLGGQMELVIYRITQELLSNILKYATASEVEISLNQMKDKINLIVADNGRGFDSGEKTFGTGLRSIKNRVEALEGTLKIDSGLGAGTTVIVNIPLAVE